MTNKMTQNFKYTVGASGSGWGVWNAEGNKMKSYTGRSIGRFQALRYLYFLNGWDWAKSKYVRAQPYLLNIEF